MEMSNSWSIKMFGGKMNRALPFLSLHGRGYWWVMLSVAVFSIDIQDKYKPFIEKRIRAKDRSIESFF